MQYLLDLDPGVQIGGLVLIYLVAVGVYAMYELYREAKIGSVEHDESTVREHRRVMREIGPR